MTKLCKDCKHIKDWPGSFPQCRHDLNLTLSLVNGAPVTVHTLEYCREPEGHCKPEGLHFKQREEA